MKRIAFALSSLALLVSTPNVVAQEDVIEARQDFMKTNGRLLGQLGPIANGEQPFDAADVLAKLEAFRDHTQTLDVAALFPEGSDEDDTRALPVIWEDFAEFEEHAQMLKDDAAAAVEAAPQDVQALKSAMGMIGENCSSCHEEYRAPED